MGSDGHAVIASTERPQFLRPHAKGVNTMATDINNVVLVGRLVRDGELRYSANGNAICNFSIAVNRRVKKGDQWSDEASFLDLALFGKTAESLNKYLVKGTQVAIQGSLEQQRWSKDGQNFSKVAVHVDSVQLLGGGQSARLASGGEGGPDAYEDDIPFAPHRM